MHALASIEAMALGLCLCFRGVGLGHSVRNSLCALVGPFSYSLRHHLPCPPPRLAATSEQRCFSAAPPTCSTSRAPTLGGCAASPFAQSSVACLALRGAGHQLWGWGFPRKPRDTSGTRRRDLPPCLVDRVRRGYRHANVPPPWAPMAGTCIACGCGAAARLHASRMATGFSDRRTAAMPPSRSSRSACCRTQPLLWRPKQWRSASRRCSRTPSLPALRGIRSRLW